MRRLSITTIGIAALAFAVSLPARADYAVLRNTDGYCEIVWVEPVPPHAPRPRVTLTIVAITDNWFSAVFEREWAWTIGDCKPLY
jgi:hypothetical protein